MDSLLRGARGDLTGVGFLQRGGQVGKTEPFIVRLPKNKLAEKPIFRHQNLPCLLPLLKSRYSKDYART
jgi:hypothetical protein